METNFDNYDELTSADELFLKFVKDNGCYPDSNYTEVIRDLGNFELCGDTLNELYKKYKLLRVALYYMQ